MNPFVIPVAALWPRPSPALAAAQAPPVKPGLWEVRSERQDGKQTTPSAEAMKNLTPETRAKVEAMMKQQGVALGSDGANRVCLSKESLDAGRWQNPANCKTEFGSRTRERLEVALGLPADRHGDRRRGGLRQPRALHRPHHDDADAFAARPRSAGRRCRPSGWAPIAVTCKPFDAKR